jgi:pyruvate,water dikinase
MRLQHLFKKKRSAETTPAEINIWHLKSLFNNFRKILHLNNRILENMARMEQSLGGEYIFEKSFLEKTVRAIASDVHHVTYNLNALTDNAYVPLYDRYQEIRMILDDILSGNTRALACPPVLQLRDVGWEMEPLVGIDLVCLAELRLHPGIQAGNGFIVTAEGTLALISDEKSGNHISRSDVCFGIEEQFGRLFLEDSSRRISVSATQINDDIGLTKDLGSFLIEPSEDNSQLLILDNSSLPDRKKLFTLPVVPTNTEKTTAPEYVEPIPIQNYIDCLQWIIERVAPEPAEDTADTAVPFAVFIRPSPPFTILGTLRTRTAISETTIPALSITSHLKGSSEAGDSFLLTRTFPFNPIRSEIVTKSQSNCFPDGNTATHHLPDHSILRRGSAIIGNSDLKMFAETAMTLERIMGVPIFLHWECLVDGTFIFTRLFPYLETSEEPTAQELLEEQQNSELLCRGTQIVQEGVAAGNVFHVTNDTSLEDFPPGAVAVARTATPELTPILQRASAILTEYGNVTGHLATVAREISLPAVFGIPDILTRLPRGVEITVDAGQLKIYAGTLNTLLRVGSRKMNLSPADPEYRILRRLLRFIMPLHLTNPETPNFCVEGCKSFHDIIHFCHEKSVDELAHFQERHPGLGSIRTKRMRLDIPMDIRVLDIGEGVNEYFEADPVVENVRQGPFSVFLEGLLNPDAWENDLPSLGLRDIISNMPRTMNIMSPNAENFGENLAIVDHDYMNLSLRLGYHFSVIDAHIGDDMHRNYVYFRFSGGLANPDRRARRAQFICNVLRDMNFKVSLKSDLVVGRLKFEETLLLKSSLYVLGALTTFSRQRDTSLYSDNETNILYDFFDKTFLSHFHETARKGQRAIAPPEEVE